MAKQPSAAGWRATKASRSAFRCHKLWKGPVVISNHISRADRVSPREFLLCNYCKKSTRLPARTIGRRHRAAPKFVFVAIDTDGPCQVAT